MAAKTRRARAPSKQPAELSAVVARPSEPHSRRFLSLLAVISLAVAMLAVGFYRSRAGEGYPLDDSWIHFTYARNLAAGLGFGANPNEATPGATSPLWVLALAPGFGAGFGHTVWPWILAALWLAASGVASGLMVLAIGGTSSEPHASLAKGMALACAATVSATAPLVWSAAGAMEVPLFSALVCFALALHARTDRPGALGGIWWGGVAGLAALARPEGLLLAVVLVAARLLRRTRADALEASTGLVTCALVYAPSVIFCLSTSGRVFPNTFYAKTTALVAGIPDPVFLVNAAVLYWELAPLTPIALAVGAVGVGVARWRGRPLEGALVAGAFALALPLAYGAMGRTFLFAGLAGNFGRYLYPVIPVALAFGFWGLWVLLAELPARRGRFAVGVLGALALGVSALGSYQRVSLYVHNVRDIESMQVAMAEKLRAQLEPGSLVAANDVGALAYLTDFRVLDLIGIISTQTLDALDEAGADEVERARALATLLERERPAALVVFPRWYAATLNRLGANRSAIAEIDNADNITSGDRHLVAYRLDWISER